MQISIRVHAAAYIMRVLYIYMSLRRHCSARATNKRVGLSAYTIYYPKEKHAAIVKKKKKKI